MVLKLHGARWTFNTQRVLVVAKELNIPIEVVHVRLLAGEHKSPEFLQKQPFGQAPYLDDDGFILFETRAICRYLASEYGGGRLLPKNGKEAALFEQAASIEQNHFNPLGDILYYERFFSPMVGLDANEARASDAQDILEKKLDVYDIILQKQAFLAGDKLTLADLFHVPLGDLIGLQTKAGNGHLDLKDAKRPNVARWWNHITSLPSWQEVMAEKDRED